MERKYSVEKGSLQVGTLRVCVCRLVSHLCFRLVKAVVACIHSSVYFPPAVNVKRGVSRGLYLFCSCIVCCYTVDHALVVHPPPGSCRYRLKVMIPSLFRSRQVNFTMNGKRSMCAMTLRQASHPRDRSLWFSTNLLVPLRDVSSLVCEYRKNKGGSITCGAQVQLASRVIEY